MIYGNRFYAFEKPITESTEDDSKYKVTYESLLDGFEAVTAVAEATNNEDVLESYANLLDENYVESLEEDANHEYTNIMRENSRTYKSQMRDARKLLTSKDYIAAKKKYVEAEKTADKFLKELDNVNSDSIGSLITADLTIFTMRFILDILVVNLARVISTANFLVKVGKGIIEAHKLIKIADEAQSIVSKFREFLKDPSKFTKALNSYRSRIHSAAELMKSIAVIAQVICDKLAKAEADKNK